MKGKRVDDLWIDVSRIGNTTPKKRMDIVGSSQAMIKPTIPHT